MLPEPTGLIPLLALLAIGARAGADPAWPSLAIAVKVAKASSEHERVIEVDLMKPLECFVAPPGTRVFLDDELLTMVSAGRMLAPNTRILRQEIDTPRCEPALFRSRPFAPQAPSVGKIRVEIGRRKGYVEIDALRTDRVVHLVKPDKLTPGQDVVLEWQPRSDVWPDKSLDASVLLVGDDGAKVKVEGPNLQVDRGRFQFAMPAMRAGGVSFYVSPGSPEPKARIAACRGFVGCEIFQQRGAPLRAEVAGTPPKTR